MSVFVLFVIVYYCYANSKLKASFLKASVKGHTHKADPRASVVSYDAKGDADETIEKLFPGTIQ